MNKFMRNIFLSSLINFTVCVIFHHHALAQSFTLEDILSAPYVTDLIADAKSNRIAWVSNQCGVRNIWIASAPDFEPLQLTNYTEDDGQLIGNLKFTHDGKTIIYVKGSNPNRRGEYANPTSDPDGAEQAIWAICSDGSQHWKLACGSAPVPSPKNGIVLYSSAGQIFEVKITHSDTIGYQSNDAKQLFKLRGRNVHPRWSPQGDQLAFVSERDDHSFIGMYDYKSHTVRWLAPGVDRDRFPAWSPDGNYLAFIRTPGLKMREEVNITSACPFSLWIVEIATGETRELWRSPGKDGGFAQYYPAEKLYWTNTNRLLFYSEHKDWMHIYSMSPDDGSPVDLTPGKSEAEHSAVSPDGTVLFYSSNENDIDRRHIWKTSTFKGKPIQLCKGQGIETDPIVLASGTYVAYRAAAVNHPPTITIQPTDGGEVKNIFPKTWPKEFPYHDLVIPQQVILKAADDLEIHCQLFLPKNARAGDQRAALIFMHGGPIRQMLLGWHYRGYYGNAYAMNQYLANKGYVVLSVDFRSGIGYGRDFRLAQNQGPRGASEYQDIIAAGLYLRQRQEVDPERIGLWGGSYGGYLTALGLARDSDLFKAGVDFHGVHDWSFRASDFSPGGGWGLQGEELLDLAYRSSPAADLTFWTSPILLIHGDDDRNVLFQQTTDLVQRLRERNVPIEMLIFPDEVHSFYRYTSWLRAFQETVDFFDKFLK
jgi:dipeptidyl aminopeptidase/acylaminoacyl peptidase